MDGCVQILLEVHGKELEDQVQTALLHDHVLEANNIGVLEFFQQRDLPDSWKGKSIAIFRTDIIHVTNSSLDVP